MESSLQNLAKGALMRSLLVSLVFFLPILSFAKEPPTVSVAVIGSGPGGLSAAFVTGRERIDTHLFLGEMPGGPVNAVTCLGNWPASVKGKGNVVMERLFEQVEKFSVHCHQEQIVSVDFADWPFHLYTEEGKEYRALAVVLATGAIPRKLGVQGEEIYANDVKTQVYLTNAHEFAGKRVAVVGGGLDAVKKATILAKEAELVHLLVRKGSLQKPFMKRRIETKGQGKVVVHYNTIVEALCGDGNHLAHLELLEDGNKQTLEIDTLVLAAGIVPNTKLVQDALEIDEQGFIVLEGRSQKTSVRGVFAAGNATDPTYRQAAISSGDGMKAGYDVIDFLTQINVVHVE